MANWRLPARLAGEFTGHDTARISIETALRCTPAIALLVVAGLLTGQHGAAAIMTGGALTIGMGVHQRLTRSRLGPMVAATIGMGASTAIGTVSGLSSIVLIAAVGLWGLAAGLLAILGGGAQWIGQQCAIALLVAGSFPGEGRAAAIRTALVVSGGLLQILLVELPLRFGDVGAELRGVRAMQRRAHAALRVLRSAVRRRTPAVRFALTACVTMAAAATFERWLAVPNGYWVAMTALLLLRPDFHDTWHRSASRIAGTVLGAAAAMAIGFAGPPLPAVAAVVVGTAFLSFVFQQYSYAVMSVWLTFFVVMLLSFGGLEGDLIARNRIIGTTVGAAFALAGHLHFRLRRAS